MTTNNAWNSASTYADFQAQNFTGFYSWAAGAPYFDDTTLGTFKLLVGGTGYVKSKKVTWVAQNITGLTAGNCYFIYIDSTGTIGKATTRTDALFTDNIVLFECLRDSTPVTNNQVTVAENHPYDFQAQPSNYLHDVIGPVINNYNNGANITLNGTQGIQINGADVLEDHGLETTIPDSGGAAVTWIRMYTDGTGKWARQNATTTFTGYYNNAGTPTALTANRYAVYTLYVSKESLNTTTPTYFAVLNTSQYTSLTAANTAISNGTTSKISNELQALEVAQLGYIVYSQASSSIVNVIISKSTLKQTLSTGGTNTASLVNTVTSAFNGWLTAANTNVQSCLDTLDDVLIGGSAGQVVTSTGAGAQPTYTTAVYPSTSGAGTVLLSNSANTITAGSSLTGDFTYTSSTAGATRILTVTNTDNTNVGSEAVIRAATGGSSAGDAQIELSTTTTNWTLGIDNSITSPGADPLVISHGSGLGLGNIMSADTTGVINYPLQSAFSAYKDATANNVTGDATTYTCTYATEIFDQNNDFDGTSTFTAPVTGRYFFWGIMNFTGLTSSHVTGQIQIVTSNRTYETNVFNPYATQSGSGYYSMSFSAFADMDAADTATFAVTITGGTKVVDVLQVNTRAGGWLVC
jgi:hypothetical protein